MHEASYLATRTVYAFGSLVSGLYGRLTLSKDGFVQNYSNENERKYTVDGGYLSFYNSSGAVTSRLREVADNIFISDDGRMLYLFPLISLGNPPERDNAPGPVFINSMPKAGTYLMESACKRSGMIAGNIHVLSRDYDDNRGIASESIHFEPQSRRNSCEASTLLSLAGKGEFFVGHIDCAAQLKNIASLDIPVINLVRNVRSALQSLYRFKKERVRSLSAADDLWRKMPDKQGFHAFLCYAEDTDVDFLRKVGKAILEADVGCILRFEDIARGVLSMTGDWRTFASLTDLQNSLEASIGKPSSTLSRDRAQQTPRESLWSEQAEEFCKSVGLIDLNRDLGYE